MTRALLSLIAALALAPSAALARVDTLTVVTLNLWHDQQDWPARRALIVEEMQRLRPDAILLQEVLQHATLKNQAQDLAETLGYRYTFSSVDPDTAVKRYGNAILSRWAMLATDWKRLRPMNDYRTAAHLRLDRLGRVVDLFSTHLHHTETPEARRCAPSRSPI
jgi:endonuclease/exonuclease/phosphatase family metal-dependent hydrolase